MSGRKREGHNFFLFFSFVIQFSFVPQVGVTPIIRNFILRHASRLTSKIESNVFFHLAFNE